MEKHTYQFIPGMQRKTTIFPLTNELQLSVVELGGEYEIALLNREGIVIHPFFGGNEVERVESWAEVEEIVGYLRLRGLV